MMQNFLYFIIRLSHTKPGDKSISKAGLLIGASLVTRKKARPGYNSGDLKSKDFDATRRKSSIYPIVWCGEF